MVGKGLKNYVVCLVCRKLSFEVSQRSEAKASVYGNLQLTMRNYKSISQIQMFSDDGDHRYSIVVLLGTQIWMIISKVT